MKDDLRLDKWLWAARFFKTRSSSQKAIEGGKVKYNGQRPKSSRTVEMGAVLNIRQGMDEKTVVIKTLSPHRRGAPQAQQMYEETPESITKRELLQTQRKLMPSINTEGRPDKKQRRTIVSFKQSQL